MSEVVIVGAGIAGLTAALCLHKQGVDVEVYDRVPQLGEVGGGLNLTPNATRLLHRLGLRERLEACSVRVDTFAMRRWDDDEVIFQNPLGAVCEERYGAPYIAIHRADLHKVLVDALPPEIIHTGRAVVGLEADGPRTRLVFEDGTEVSAGTVIGADGIRSAVRGGLLPGAARFSGQALCRGLVPAERAEEIAASGTATLWVGPGKHMMCYPVRSGELVNWAIAVPGDGRDPESWTAEATPEAALDVVEGWNARARGLIAATERTLLFPLYDREPVTRLAFGNVTLIGDAAHPMLPFMSQGAGQGIEDAWVLACLLADRSERAVADRLEMYQSLRVERTRQLQLLSRANSDMFHHDDGEEQRRRDADLKAGAMAPEAFDWLFGYDAAEVVAGALRGADA